MILIHGDDDLCYLVLDGLRVYLKARMVQEAVVDRVLEVDEEVDWSHIFFLADGRWKTMILTSDNSNI